MEKVNAIIMADKIKRYLLPKTITNVYRNCVRTMQVFKKDGDPLFFMVYDKNYAKNIKWWYLRKNEYILKKVDSACTWKELTNDIPVYITNDFWVCSCEKYFLKHKAEMRCKYCQAWYADAEKLLGTPTFMARCE